MIGEMQFRYKALPSNYHANHFVYETERAGANIEILEAFNKQAKYMSRHNELAFRTLKIDHIKKLTSHSDY